MGTMITKHVMHVITTGHVFILHKNQWIDVTQMQNHSCKRNPQTIQIIQNIRRSTKFSEMLPGKCVWQENGYNLNLGIRFTIKAKENTQRAKHGWMFIRRGYMSWIAGVKCQGCVIQTGFIETVWQLSFCSFSSENNLSAFQTPIISLFGTCKRFSMFLWKGIQTKNDDLYI